MVRYAVSCPTRVAGREEGVPDSRGKARKEGLPGLLNWAHVSFLRVPSQTKHFVVLLPFAILVLNAFGRCGFFIRRKSMLLHAGKSHWPEQRTFHARSFYRVIHVTYARHCRNLDQARQVRIFPAGQVKQAMDHREGTCQEAGCAALYSTRLQLSCQEPWKVHIHHQA
jgi:hypothetical protein